MRGVFLRFEKHTTFIRTTNGDSSKGTMQVINAATEDEFIVQASYGLCGKSVEVLCVGG